MLASTQFELPFVSSLSSYGFGHHMLRYIFCSLWYLVEINFVSSLVFQAFGLHMLIVSSLARHLLGQRKWRYILSTLEWVGFDHHILKLFVPARIGGVY